MKTKYYAKQKCGVCGKIPWNTNPKLIPRHQHIGFVIRIKSLKDKKIKPRRKNK